MLKNYIKIALNELNLPENLYSQKLEETIKNLSLNNYFEVLDILYFNIKKKTSNPTRIVPIKLDDVIMLNNISVEMFGNGHNNTSFIKKYTVTKDFETIEYCQYLGLYTIIEEYIDKECQVYLIPNYQVKLIPLRKV